MNLLFTGKLTKEDGTAYYDADVITLTNNSLMHLFNEIRLYPGGQVIETLHYPEQSMTMLRECLCKSGPVDFS